MEKVCVAPVARVATNQRAMREKETVSYVPKDESLRQLGQRLFREKIRYLQDILR
ncbi:Hypothetical protein FKW44_000726, partial [Caligus rogercresseyi]